MDGDGVLRDLEGLVIEGSSFTRLAVGSGWFLGSHPKHPKPSLIQLELLMLSGRRFD